MLFSELPLDVIRVVFEECVLQWGLWHAVRHRLVNKFFDQEIRHAICATRYLERYAGRESYSFNRELKQQYLEYIVQIGNPGNTNLARAIEDSVNTLSIDDKESSPDVVAKRTSLLCKRAVEQTAPYPGHLFSSRPVSEDITPYDAPHRIVENTLLAAALLCEEISTRLDLLDNTQHLSASNFFFGTPLACAATTGSEAAVKLLLSKGAQDSFNGESAIEVAAMKGHDRILQILLDADADGSVYGRGPETFKRIFARAVRSSQLSMVEMLLASDLAINNEHTMNGQVYYAAMRRDESMVRFLLANTTGCWGKPGAERHWHINALSATPGITRVLMDALAFDKHVVSQAAVRAAGRGHLDTFRYISYRHSDILLRFSLAKAATNGRYDVISYVLERLTPPVETIWSPMQRAAERGFDSVVRLLYQYGSKSEDWHSVGKALRDSIISAKQQKHLNIVHTLSELWKSVMEHVESDLSKELNDLLEGRTPVDSPTLILPTSSPLVM